MNLDVSMMFLCVLSVYSAVDGLGYCFWKIKMWWGWLKALEVIIWWKSRLKTCFCVCWCSQITSRFLQPCHDFEIVPQFLQPCLNFVGRSKLLSGHKIVPRFAKSWHKAEKPFSSYFYIFNPFWPSRIV